MRNRIMKTLLSIVTASMLLISTSSFADSCEQAAYFYEKGQHRNARTLLEPLVLKGEACAEYYMGLLYKRGQGVKMNSSKGLSLIQSASKKGYPKAIIYIDENI